MPVIVQAPSCCFWPNLNPISNPAIRPIPANSFSITPPLHFLKTNNFQSPNVTSAKGHRFFNTASVRAAASARADYYSTLNVSRNATLQEIKSSYRKLARKVSLYMCVCVWISFIFDFDMLSYFLEIYSICLWFGMYVQYHPDMNKGAGAEDKFKEISAAYEVAD